MTRPTASRLVAGTLLLTVALCAPRLVAAGDWKGSEETIDGVLHIENPSTAIDEPMTINLDEVYRLGGWNEDQLFGVITGILEDEDGNVYLLDSQLKEIQVFDSEGNQINTIGREGEAPGEFQNAGSMFWMPDGKIGVMQTFPGRIVQLGKDGTPYDDFEIPKLPENDTGFRILRGAKRVGDDLAIVESVNKVTQQDFNQLSYLNIYDPETGSYTALHDDTSYMSFTEPVIEEKQFDNFFNRWTGSSSGKVYSVNSLSDYAITVYSLDGSVDRVIEREIAPLKRTDEEVAKLLEVYKGFTKQIPIPNKTYDIEPNHAVVSFNGVYDRPDGSLWVRTSLGTAGGPDDELGAFDIFDPKGRYVRRVVLKGQANSLNDAVFFVNDHIYVITDFLTAAMNAQGGGAGDEADETEDDDAEPMAVICYRSDELLKAAGIPKGKPTDSR